jgi:outer membrane protein TolC
VIAADLEVRAALARSQSARLERLPEVEVEGGYVFGVGPSAGISLELPLFAPRLAAVHSAEAETRLAEALRQSAQDNAASLLSNAQEELELSRRAAEAWKAVNLEPARLSAQQRFTAGELALPEYLTLRDSVAIHAMEAIDARWRLQRATLALWELTGQIPQEKQP